MKIMASDEELLKALEALMTEFFDMGTSNERKREIENQVNNFSQQQGALKHCLFFLSHTSNEFVMMYCLTVLETLINKQWISMLGEEKSEIRTTLYKFLLTNHRQVPNFIRNKLCKIVVDIGSIDWPHFFPDFFSNILELIQNSDTTSLGLMLLQTASEELAFPRENLSNSRKEELLKLLSDQVPAVLSIVGGLLENILDKHRHLVTATPPPSPTHGSPQLSLFSTSPLDTSDFLNSMFKATNKSPFETLPPLDLESHQLCVQALNALAQLFSWITLSTSLTPSLLTTVFHFASFGCDPVATHHEVTNKSQLGILAMGCINEIMSKNCVPAEFEDFMLQMFQYTFHLLQRVTKDLPSSTCGASTSSNSTNSLASLDENYIEKFTDFLRLFVNGHLPRFENNTQFPILEFLELLFHYTFHQPTQHGFYSCLEIWGTFLDYLTSQSKHRVNVADRYHQALHLLVTEILTKMQFKFNQTSLEELDDESLDDDSETEWQRFLRHSLETIAKVAEIMPLQTFGIMYSVFQSNLDIYLGLENYVGTVEGKVGLQLRVTAENECRRLHCSLRDLSSILQGIGRLSNFFIGEEFFKNFSTIQDTLKRLCHMAIYSNKMKLYHVQTAANSVLRADFIEVHAQTLATIKAFCHWLFQYYCETLQNNHQKDDFTLSITSLVEATVPILTSQTPEKVRHSAVHLFLSVTATVRPSFLFTLAPVRQLFESSTRGDLHNLPLETQLLAYRSLGNILLLPWPNVSDADQEWVKRSEHYEVFILSLSLTLKRICSTTGFSDHKEIQDQAKSILKWTLCVLTDQIVNLEEATVRTKQIAYQPLQDVIYHIVTLFPIYLSQPDIGEVIMDFFLALFNVLRGQMGVQFAEQTVQNFLSLFTRDQLAQCILHEGSAGARLVEKFLKLLQQVVQEPGSAFKTFLPSTIDFCMNHIYPIIAERPSPEVKLPLFELLYQLMLHNWKHFFKNRIIDTLGQSGNETVENSEDLTKIMQAYGQSFLQPDLNVYRHNLKALENLNDKWKLYHKALFKNLMLNQFLNVLLQTLVLRSHDLLQEEIGVTIYNMASVDFENFYGVFLPQFLCVCDGLDDNQRTILARNFKLEMDLPSFTQSIRRFVNDLRYYQLCNNSLPPGSVRL